MADHGVPLSGHISADTVHYDDPKALRSYTRWLTVAVIAVFMTITATGSILLPNKVQDIQEDKYFTGPDAGVDVQDLAILSAKVEDGEAEPKDETERRRLEIYDDFDSARASALAVANTLAAIGIMISSVIIGVSSDRTRSKRGRRAPFVLGGAVLSAVVVLFIGVTPSIWLLALVFAVFAITSHAATGPLLTTVAERVPTERLGKVSSMSGFGTFLGGIGGAVIAGLLFKFLGFYLALVFGVIVVAGAVAFMTRCPDKPSTDIEVEPFDWGAFFRGLRVPLQAPDFRWVWIARVLLVFGYTVSTVLTFFILQSYIEPALSVEEATEMTPLLALASAPATLLAVVIVGNLSDRVGRRKIFVVAASMLMAVSFLIPLISPTLPALFVQVVIAGFAFGVFLPVDQALFIEVLPDQKSLGRDLGVATVATNLGQVLAPVLAAGVVAVTGGYGALWIVATSLVAVAGLAIFRVQGAR